MNEYLQHTPESGVCLGLFFPWISQGFVLSTPVRLECRAGPAQVLQKTSCAQWT